MSLFQAYAATTTHGAPHTTLPTSTYSITLLSATLIAPPVGATLHETIQQRAARPAASTADDTHFGRRCATNSGGLGAGETRSGMYDVGWEAKWLVEYMQVPPQGAVPCVGCALVRVRCLFEALGCSRQATPSLFAPTRF